MQLAQALIERYVDRYPGEAARSLIDLAIQEAVKLVAAMPLKAQLLSLENMSPPDASRMLVNLPAETAAHLLEYAPPYMAVEWLFATGSEQRHMLLQGMSAGHSSDLEKLLNLPDDAAGRLMDREVTVLQIDMTVFQALERLREARSESLRSLYVVDRSGELRGVVHVQDLALVPRDEKLSNILCPEVPSVGIESEQAQLVALLERHRTDSLPVLSAGNKLVGVVRHDQLFEAIEDVATADLQTMVGARADESALTPPLEAVRGRLPWLHVNLATAFVASGVVALFEDLIAQFTALAILLPIVAGQSGNAGSQALAVTIRGLALGEVGVRQWSRVLGKEVGVGILNGVALAVTCGLGVYLWSGSMGLGMVIALAMVVSMVVAGVFGAVVPIVMQRLGQDPAVASSIILTTGTDVAGFLAFLGLALAFSSLL